MANQFSHSEIASVIAQSKKDGLPDLYELYHLRSSLDKQHLFEISSSIQRALAQESIVSSFGKSISALNLPKTPLVNPQTSVAQHVRKIWHKRVSVRKYSASEIKLAELSILIDALRGAPSMLPHRSYPSAGACFPNEIFLNLRRVESIDPGFYYADLGANDLRLISEKNSLLTLDEYECDTSLSVIIISLFNRVTYKYGERGYRFALLEAGAMTQIIETTASHLGLGAVSSGGYRDDLILEAAELTTPQAGVMTVIHVGRKD